MSSTWTEFQAFMKRKFDAKRKQLIADKERVTLVLKAEAFNKISKIANCIDISYEDTINMINEVIRPCHMDIRDAKMKACSKQMDYHQCAYCKRTNKTERMLACKALRAGK